MAVVASWDFPNRRIYMAVAEWHPYDIYVEYRAYRRTVEAARPFDALLRYEGNIPKGGGKATPRYMVLLNGTKIVPLDGTIAPVTDITGEVFADDQSDFIDISGLTQAPRINYAPPSAEIVVQVAQLAEIQHSSFNGGVTIDTLGGQAGTAYPIGTPRYPVNNVTDARTIAAARGFSTLFIKGDIVLDTGDDVSYMRVIGENAARTYVQINPGASCLGVEIREATVSGTLDGTTILRDSYVFDLDYVSGFIFQCQLAGTITLGGVMPASIMSAYAGANGVTIDMGGSGHSLNMAGMYGDISIANKTGTDICKMHSAGASVTLLPTVTNGAGIHIDGTGDFKNLSSITPDEVDMVSPSSVADAVWNKQLP